MKLFVTTSPTNWGSSTVILDKETIEGPIEIGIFTCEPGKALERHGHNEAAEWCYILSGEAVFDCDGEITHAKPGDLVYLPAYSNHTSYPNGDVAFTSLYIVCKDS
jgi:mannose-6-phosphate isomerase-like protein (cupin superfamily)